jgi:hypothetical protein
MISDSEDRGPRQIWHSENADRKKLLQENRSHRFPIEVILVAAHGEALSK